METTRRHPIRGLLWGLPFGLGLALIAIGQSWAALGTWPPVLLVIVGMAVGALWSSFGPARGGRDPSGGDQPPEAADPSPSAA